MRVPTVGWLAAPWGARAPAVASPKSAPRFSQDECLKRAEMARNLALFDRALEFADEAIVADPRKPLAWAAKAEVLFGLKRFSDAAAHAKKVVEMNPKYAPGWMRLAASYADDGCDARFVDRVVREARELFELDGQL